MGTKRKIEIEKRETPEQRSVTCNKRRRTVFKKATELCLLAGANVVVFVTSPAENSDVVYSFSGYSPASEIAACFLKGKLPPPPPKRKLGFCWEDPDLYTYCDDVTELNIIENRLLRMKNDVMDCIIKKEKGKQVVPSLKPSSHDIRGESCSQIVSFDQQNPSTSLEENHGGISSQFSFDRNLNPSSDDIHGESCSQIVSFEQENPSSSFEENHGGISSHLSFDQSPNLSYSLDEIYGGSSSQLDQNPSFFIQGEPSSCFENNSITLTQETQEEPMMVYLSGYDEESSFWDNLVYDEDVFVLNSGFHLDNNNPQTNTTNEEDDYMIDISEFFNEEEIKLLQF